MNGFKRKVLSVLLALIMVVGIIQPVEAVSAEPTNIALGKEVIVSGTSDGNKDYVNDGNTDTKWDSNFIKNGAADIDDAWIYIDLGENVSYEISRIVVKFFNKIYPTSWVVQTSEDVQIWTDVTDIMTKENNGPTHPVETIDFETPVTGRYVRLYFNTLNTAAGGNGIGITEFEVYAEEIQPAGLEWYDVPYNSGDILYEGTWGQDDLGMNSYNEDAKATLVFYGTGIKWVGQTDSNFGTAMVTIDDGTPVEVSAKGGVATGVTHFAAENLTQGVHTITIEPVGGTIKNDVIDINKLIVQYDKTWNIPVSEVIASIAPGVLLTGRTKQIEVNVQPFNAKDQNFTFESSDDAIVTVDEKGIVKGIKAGDAEVTVKAGTVEAKISLNVKEATAEDQRLIVDNEHPLLIVPLYVQDSATGQLQWGDTLLGRWKSIPDDIKANTVMLIHGGNAKVATLKSFYISQLEIAEKNNIPVVLLTASAGNNSAYTPLHSLDEVWLEEQMQTYSCLKGFMISENHWLPGSVDTIVTAAAKYMKVASEYGGYLFWFDHNRNNYEQMVFSNAKFKAAMAEYSDAVVFGWKNTAAQASVRQNAKSGAYVQGMWLDGQIGQWGGNMDTWKWYEAKYGKLFEGKVSGYNGSTPNGEDEECRTVVMEPEALLGMEMLSIYANGGCVYSFEHPAYTQGIDDLNTPLFDSVIYETFKYAIENPAPTREEILEDTKVFIHGNLNDMKNDVYNLIMEDQALPTYQTGQYGLLPGVPAGTEIQSIDKDKVVELSEIGNMTAEQSKVYLAEIYAENAYEGDAFAQKISDNEDANDTWVIYNSNFNEDVAQSATINVNEQNVKVDMEAHTFAVLENTEDGISVYLNNYRVNKNEIWENYGPSAVKWDPDLSANTYMQDWIRNNYMTNTKDKEDTYRTTTFTLGGLTAEPVVNVTRQKEDDFVIKLTYDAEAGAATIEITSNGYAYFTIGEEAVPDEKVVRIAGEGRIDTGFAVADTLKETLGLEKFDTVILATSKTFADALPGSYLAYVNNAPILLINDARMNDVIAYVNANLADGGKVYILGGISAVSAAVEAKLEGYDVERLQVDGKGRYFTNLEILKAAGVHGGEMIVATGQEFADSLSASAVKLPILMVRNELSDEQKEFLAASGIEKFYIVGGEGAVGAAIEKELAAYAAVERLEGNTRRETTIKVAKKFFENSDKVVVASASAFPDGLCGGPLAAALNAPLVLTVNGKTGEAAAYTAANGIKAGYVLGGAGAMTNETVINVFALESADQIIVK